ncbi:MAG: porin [Betaproteobacteria bacterium]|uniref:porin n=1 Tax=Thiomonas TaxID=32012 RepID=UPI002382D65C|nr:MULTISPECIES: porin [Thiomonas]MDE1979610.1 porin [Betaproteobacteria bacterium]MDE2268820.1 porin [Betaproteobacteria bacterium]HML81309.1 porin [Thiomonas arsenitoxydans]
MKKSIMAAVVIGACCQMAHAKEGAQLYGVIDMGIERLTYDNTSLNRLGSGVQSTDRIGIRGQENLGGGLQTFFYVETGFCGNGTNSFPGSLVYKGDNSAVGSSVCSGGGFMGRLSVLGLKSRYGVFKAGRFYSLNYDNLVKIDPFMTGMTGAVKNIDPAGYNYVRFSQAVGYRTPDFGGLTAAMLYAFGGQPGSFSKGQSYELNVDYESKKFTAGIDYLKNNHPYSAGSKFNPYVALAWEFGPAATLTQQGSFNNEVVQLYGGYDFSVAKLTALYSDEKYGDGLPYAAGHFVPDLKIWMLGATIPLPRGKFLASISRRSDMNKSDTTATQVAIGYLYPLSKRTNIYTSYSRIRNDSATDLYVGDNGFTAQGTVGGASASGLTIGLRHFF